MMPATIYLNTASCGLLSPESVKATQQLYDGMITNASAAVEPIRDSGIERIRTLVADFIDAPSKQIAFIPNFSWGLNAIVQSLRGNERVLMYQHDYPSLTAPFKTKAFELSWIADTDGFEINESALKQKLLEEKIEILAISHVQWLSGFQIDVASIGSFCREHNIVFLLDATQSLGAIPLFPERQSIDVLISSNYKWMNAGFGMGIMYVSENFSEKYPAVVGGSKGESNIYSPATREFEPGHLNMHALLLLEKALEYKLNTGIETIEAHNHRQVKMLLESLPAALILGGSTLQGRSPIIVLKDPGTLYEHLTNQGVVAIKRGTNIRIGVHFYNTEEEINHFLSIVRAFPEKLC